MQPVSNPQVKKANRVCFPYRSHLLFFSPDQIIRLEALSNYTYVYFTNHAPILMAKVLHQYETMLEPFGFLRTHRSHLVNTQHIQKFERSGRIFMCDESQAEVSRSRKRRVFDELSQHHFAA